MGVYFWGFDFVLWASSGVSMATYLLVWQTQSSEATIYLRICAATELQWNIQPVCDLLAMAISKDGLQFFMCLKENLASYCLTIQPQLLLPSIKLHSQIIVCSHMLFCINMRLVIFCGFCGQLVIWEIFILEILLVKIWLVAIGEQGMCEETFDICKYAATEAGPERLHIVRPYF